MKTEHKTCETCLYRGTHEKCEGCLGDTQVVNQADSSVYRFDYKNWQRSTLGEALERLHALEVSGGRNIVIGGSGEAEVNARWSVGQAFKELVRISEACGYLTRRPVFHGDKAIIQIVGSWNGPRFLVWVSGNFDHIETENGVYQWDRHPEFIKTQLGKAYSMGGTPRALMAC